MHGTLRFGLGVYSPGIYRLGGYNLGVYSHATEILTRGMHPSGLEGYIL